MSLKVGDLVFVKNNSIISRVVRLVSTGKFNQDVPYHVAIVTAIYSGIVVLTEATYGKGVHLQDLSTYDNDTVWIKRMKDPRDIPKGLRFLNDQIGLKYDKFAILGIVGRAFFRLFGNRVYQRVKLVRNFLDSRTKFFCSEVTAYYGMETGKRLWKAHPSETTPYDLWRSEELYDIDYYSPSKISSKIPYTPTIAFALILLCLTSCSSLTIIRNEKGEVIQTISRGLQETDIDKDGNVKHKMKVDWLPKDMLTIYKD